LGAIKIHEFTTVDGVVDTPMWTADYGFPEDLSATIGALTGDASGILLGRRTFEMFAPAWSTRTAEDDPGAPFFNDSPKYVVSSTLTDAGSVWQNSTVVGGYDADRLRALKDEAGDLYVSGSATLVRALLADVWSTSCTCSSTPSPSGPASGSSRTARRARRSRCSAPTA